MRSKTRKSWLHLGAGVSLAASLMITGCTSGHISRPAGVTDLDKNVATIVYGRLSADVNVDADAIGVNVDHGIVTLNGIVPDMSQRANAEAIARSTDGVEDVVNDLEIRTWDDNGLKEGFPPFSTGFTP